MPCQSAGADSPAWVGCLEMSALSVEGVVAAHDVGVRTCQVGSSNTRELAMPADKSDYDAILAYVSDTVSGGGTLHPEDILSDGRKAIMVASDVMAAQRKGSLSVDEEPGLMVVGHLLNTWRDGFSVDPDDYLTELDTFQDLLGDHFNVKVHGAPEVHQDVPVVMRALGEVSAYPNVEISPDLRTEDGRRLRPLVLTLVPMLEAEDGADPLVVDTLSTIASVWEMYPRGDVPQTQACDHSTVAANVKAWVAAQAAPRP